MGNALPKPIDGGDVVEVRTVIEASGTTAVLTGEADADNCAQIGAVLLARDVTGPVSLDLSGLTFLDSSAISELLRVHKELGERAIEVSVGDVSPPVRRILEITGLLELFGLAAS